MLSSLLHHQERSGSDFSARGYHQCRQTLSETHWQTGKIPQPYGKGRESAELQLGRGKGLREGHVSKTQGHGV